VRARSLKIEESDKSKKRCSSKKISRCSSQEHEHSTNDDMKTIKKTDTLKKKNYFEEWERPCTRGPSAEKKLKDRGEVRRNNHYYKAMKAPAVRLRRWTTDAPSETQNHLIKALAGQKLVAKK
jgi:hypothetical protein